MTESAPQLFIATYLANRSLAAPEAPSPVARAFITARAAGGADAFPYDGADDPSFFCSKHLNNRLTWGVCRTDVRNTIRPGDWIAFFSGERIGSDDVDYRFVALQKVEGKVSAFDLPPMFKDYLNRLVRQDTNGDWLHDEPALGEADWHSDWLWRVSAGGASEGDKAALEKRGAAGTVPASFVATPKMSAKNYVVFQRGAGFILAHPILVARKTAAAEKETWLDDTGIKKLREALFGAAADRHLRTTNRAQPHRHVRRPLVDATSLVDHISEMEIVKNAL